MKKSFLILFLLLGGFFCGNAEHYELTLEESIEIAKRKSYTMLRLIQDLKIAEYNLKSTKSQFKTHIDMTLSAPQYSEEVVQEKDSLGIHFYTEKQLNFFSNLTITQPLPTDGKISLESGLSTMNDLRTDVRSARFNTTLRFQQPFDAFYGYNSIKARHRKAELNYEQTSKQLKREELSLIYQVSRTYYNLLSLQKSMEIALLDLDRQKEAFEISKNKYEAGLIREVEALQMEVDLAEAQNSYDVVILHLESAMNSFKEMIGINLYDTLSLKSELNYKIVVIDPEKAVRLALANRPEIREQDIQLTIQDLNVKEQKAAGMIKTSLVAHYGKTGIAQGKDLDYMESIKNSFSNFGGPQSNYGVGLTVSIPILDWGENRALVRASQARLIQYEYRKKELEREIETSVRNLAATVSSNLKRLQQLEKNIVVAEKSFEITLQRFAEGDIDSQSLSLERTRMNNAYRNHLSAYIDYQTSLIELMNNTFYDFEKEELIQ